MVFSRLASKNRRQKAALLVLGFVSGAVHEMRRAGSPDPDHHGTFIAGMAGVLSIGVSVTPTVTAAEQVPSLWIHADVRVKLRKSQTRKESGAAAGRKCHELIIAAGGDGTVEAVASGLVGTEATLGIIPLGTYNNVATCLGIPTGVEQACALIAGGAARRIDVGQVVAQYMKRPRIFLEVSAVGLGACMYEDMDQPAVLGQFLPSAVGNSSGVQEGKVHRSRARTVEIHTTRPMPVSIESTLSSTRRLRPSCAQAHLRRTRSHPLRPKMVPAVPRNNTGLTGPP
jgi:diacylglycerol kinase family enzyme